MSINVQHISKHFGSFHALDNIQLDIESGELLALLGPSGCGKTTLLRIIAGLETADAGQIVISGEDSTHVHVRERNVGFVFQHYALFRHMTVADNVAFGLRVKPRSERPSEKQIQAKVHDLLKLVQLDWLADRYPAQLSGGQRQRIALARALAVEPKVLLLDEPFGALDAQVRKELRRWLRRLHDELHVTSIFVTHDQEEALEVADRVVLMNHGRIEQVGSPREVWEHPATPFVARFLGGVPLVGDGTRPLRPHELEVRRLAPGEPATGGVLATLRRALVLDPVVRLELEPASGAHELIEARLGTAQFAALGLREGDTVLVTPRATPAAAEPALA
jgi:sulfate transport system ATP-binding protein